jgi:predicted RNase H-like HicB family nuclease
LAKNIKPYNILGIDKKFEPIQITIVRDKETQQYIALFNICGGGSQADTIDKLLNNCKVVIKLVQETKEVIKQGSKKIKK